MALESSCCPRKKNPKKNANIIEDDDDDYIIYRILLLLVSVRGERTDIPREQFVDCVGVEIYTTYYIGREKRWIFMCTCV